MSRPLSEAVESWLLSQGVTHFGMAGLREALVGFDEAGDRFDFADGELGERAIVGLARDEASDVVDLWCWSARLGVVATHLGRAPVIGANDLARWLPDPPVLHDALLDWLRADQRGAFVLEPAKARTLLLDLAAEGPLYVPSAAGRARLLRALIPEILVMPRPDLQ